MLIKNRFNASAKLAESLESIDGNVAALLLREFDAL